MFSHKTSTNWFLSGRDCSCQKPIAWSNSCMITPFFLHRSSRDTSWGPSRQNSFPTADQHLPICVIRMRDIQSINHVMTGETYPVLLTNLTQLVSVLFTFHRMHDTFSSACIASSRVAFWRSFTKYKILLKYRELALDDISYTNQVEKPYSAVEVYRAIKQVPFRRLRTTTPLGLVFRVSNTCTLPPPQYVHMVHLPELSITYGIVLVSHNVWRDLCTLLFVRLLLVLICFSV